ncbi:hypothetical protein HYT92_01620 [Candidatus Pacearchaeota archaeon]|nr:hypothetical protein [Candidatus Pacearchaeota archaeon]
MKTKSLVGLVLAILGVLLLVILMIRAKTIKPPASLGCMAFILLGAYLIISDM